MKHSKKILSILMTLGLCVVFAACGSPAGNTGGNSVQTESAAADSTDEAAPAASEAAADEAEDATTEPASDQADDTAKGACIGIIAWSMARGDEAEFIESVQTTLSEQYSDQIGDVFVGDATQDAALLSMIMDNMKVMWEGENIVVLIVNDDEDGFSDEELLSVLQDADQAGIIAGVDHAIDGAPESAFVYDVSDAAGCAAAIVENAAGM